MSKKIRVNREFDSLNEAADYFNYYLSKNPEGEISISDLKKIAEKNGWTLEEQGIGNRLYRPVLSDADGMQLGLTMLPHFDVYEPECEDGDLEEDADSEEEQDESEEESEDEQEDSDTEDDEESEAPSTEETFAWVQPGETFVWRDPNDDNPETSEHSATVVEVKSEDGKVHTDTTEIRADVEGVGVISIFCDEIVMLDEEDEDPDESGEEDIEDAEIVEESDDTDDTDKSDEDSED
jgi:hypothetical protein